MKKVISLFLVMAMLTALFTVSVSANWSLPDEGAISVTEAVQAYFAENGELPLQRIYFQMPNGKRGGTADDDVYVHRTVYDEETGDIVDEYDEVVIPAGAKAPSWYSDFNVIDGKHYAGIYWWEGPAAESTWCGYIAEIEDYDQGIYYADVPAGEDDYVTTLIWNNGVDGGMDPAEPIYYEAAQVSDLNVEGMDEGESDTLPEGTPDFNFDGCIYIVNPNQVSINPLTNKQTCGGDWYAYYGNGCYGNYLMDSDNFVSAEENCVNPDHFVDGVHVGYHEDTVEPTEAPVPTEAPTEAPVPTEAPTEAPAPTEPPVVTDPTKLYFDVNGTGWTMGDKDKVGFYVFPLSDDVSSAYKSWGGKRLQGTDEGNGLWSYNAANFKLEEGVQYKIIFAHVVNNAFTDQTYDLFFDTTCLGDIAYCDGTQYENPVDSSKKTLAAFWRGKDAAEYGPVLQISSIGNVIGTCPEQGKTPEDVFNDFLTVVSSDTGKTGLDNARAYVVDVGTKTEQQLIDDIGLALGLSKQQVFDLVSGLDVDWTYTESPLDGEVVPPTEAPTEAPTDAPHVHTPGEPVRENEKPATCTAEGSYDEVIYCTECGEEISRETKTIDKIPHTEGEAVRENVVEADCEHAGGYDNVVRCTVCGEILMSLHVDVPALGHDLVFVEEVPATYDAAGVKAHYECSRCHKKFADATGTVEVTDADLYIAPLERPTEAPAPTEAPTDAPAPTEAPKVEGIRGDIDNTGEVDIVDVTVIQRVLAEITPSTREMEVRGDVDNSGDLESIDATLIQRWLVGLNDSYGIGEAL